MFSRSILPVIASLLAQTQLITAQTFSSCNPLYSTGCPANTALGKAISVDFTKGSVNSFTATGNPAYDSDGVHFTVTKGGDAPTLSSVFYIMFGKVSITMKTAPGAGIVSTLVLQSDDLDEIDLEWLGSDPAQVQTNYFGKGDVTTYNRGEFNPAPNHQAEYITYTVEWTSSQITWSVGNKIIRVLTPATADTNQYPQSPMQIKFGSWSGGDPANPAGTVAWAGGPTDYSKGPFTMSVRSIAVTDYSTGTQYKYGDTSGSWQSIQAIGGKINGNAGGAAATVATADLPSATSASPSIPAGVGSTHGSTATLTGWPWVASTTLVTATQAATSTAGIPSGWIITSSGKIVPASSAATSIPSTTISPPSPSSPPSGYEAITGWDDRGFPTTKTVPVGWATMPKSYDQQGNLITSIAAGTSAAVAAVATTNAACFGANCGPNGKVIQTSSSMAEAAAKPTMAWQHAAVLGVAAMVVERLL